MGFGCADAGQAEVAAPSGFCGATMITIRFSLPSAALAPYVTTYYWSGLKAADGTWIEDYLHPEWPNVRFIGEGANLSSLDGGALQETPRFAVTGTTSVAAKFRMSSGRSWGIGLLPLGWQRFIGAPAHLYADRVTDGHRDPAMAAFRPLAEKLEASDGDFASELALIEAHMESLLDCPEGDTAGTEALNAALLDESLHSVADIAHRLDMNVRSVERLSKRVFGLPPKLLMRRQRFLRSLAQFMLDPSLKWLNAMDSSYHDQAHFTRDFRRFMGVSPSEYSRLDHPILSAAARARAELLGEAVQGLHRPASRK